MIIRYCIQINFINHYTLYIFFNSNVEIYRNVLKFDQFDEDIRKIEYNIYHETGRIVPVFLMNQIKEEQHG